MNARIWSNLQGKSSHSRSGWQLVGRGSPSSAPTKDDGRTVRPLTYQEITEKMSSEDAAWHIHFNKKNWDAAFAEQEKRYASKKFVAKSKVELQWQGHATPEEDEAAIQAAQNFTKKFPQFERSIENIQKMIDHMQQRNYDGTDEASYVRAFRELVDAGKITVKPTESANEYLQKHPELKDTRTPPIIKAREAKNQATAEAFSKAEAATAASGSTKVVDYAPEQQGPLYANVDKQSFRALLRNLGADDYQARLNSDPSFREAVDRIQNEK